MSDVIQGNKYRLQAPIKRRAREALRTSAHGGKKEKRKKEKEEEEGRDKEKVVFLCCGSPLRFVSYLRENRDRGRPRTRRFGLLKACLSSDPGESARPRNLAEHKFESASPPFILLLKASFTQKVSSDDEKWICMVS